MIESNELYTTRKRILNSLASSVGLIILVHLLPKDTASYDTSRLVFTAVYFGGLIAICNDLIANYLPYLKESYEYCYSDAPQTIHKLMSRYVYSLCLLIKRILIAVLIFFIFTAFLKITPWFSQSVQFNDAIANLWWVSFFAVALSPWWSYLLIIETLQRRKAFYEEVTVSNFQPNKIIYSGIRNPVNEEVVISVQKEEFEAGGRVWRHSDLVKSLITFGQPGSGKTVCVLNSLLQGIINSTRDPKSSGLILDPKGDYLTKIKKLLSDAGREEDLIIFDPSDKNSTVHWNPLDSADDAYELSEKFASVTEVLGMKDTQSSFWTDKSKQFVQNAIILIKQSTGGIPSLSDIGELASSKEKIIELSEEIKEDDSEGLKAVSYFTKEWFKVPAETLGGIQGHITAMTNPFTIEPYQTFTSGKSSFAISDIIDSTKILYVNMPVAEKEAMSKVLGTFIKLEFYKEILRRKDKKNPSFFFCDEFQVFFNAGKGKGDADFFERSRQSNHANIIACQNLQSLFKQVDRKEPVLNLLGTCAIKNFMRNTDQETNQYASDLFGQALYGVSGGTGGVHSFSRKSRVTGGVSFSDQLSHVIRPEKFSELAIPSSEPGRNYAESIIHDATANKPGEQPKKRVWRVNPL